MIVMDSSTQLKLDIITKVAEGKISINNAAKLLNRSRRTIERYISQYQTQGIKFVIHGNTGKPPINKIPNELKNTVQLLIKNKYHDTNLAHLSELLLANENIHIKRETLRAWAHDIHHVKRTKRRHSKARKKRERMCSAGLMLQMDGSTHRWFGGKKSCLIAIIDDATSELYAEFFESETTQGCMKVMRGYIEKKGLFKTLYVDRAGIFGGPKRCNFSQVQRACDELGIEIIFASSPQGKGRIERAFDTLQDRLIPELRLQNIDDMKHANEYLNEKFIPNYWNANLTVLAENGDSEFIQIPQKINLDKIFIRKEYRTIRNDHTFSFNNKMYLIESELKYSIAKQKIEIHISAENDFAAYYAGRPLSISEVVHPTKPILYDIEIQKKIDAIELANKLGNVSEAARISGCSRESIYKNRRLLEEKGPHALKRTFKTDKRHKNRTGSNIEKSVIECSLKNPHLGQAQISSQLKLQYDIEISASGVRHIWLRESMNTMAMRLDKVRQMGQ